MPGGMPKYRIVIGYSLGQIRKRDSKLMANIRISRIFTLIYRIYNFGITTK